MPLDILCIGAHPDDVEGSMGGTAALFVKRGDSVTIVSVTDGSKGHFREEYIHGPELLAHRRWLEAENASAVINATYKSLGISDGELYVTPANTEEMVRLIRSTGKPGIGPDLIITNRPNDYHRDHRYTAQLVLDSVYMLTVPSMCPDTPFLRRMPVIAYWQDDFNEGGSFRPDSIIDISSVLDVKTKMTMAHESQYFEWLPFNSMTLDSVPEDYALRYKMRYEAVTNRALEIGNKVPMSNELFVEAFQISEYGRQPEESELATLFPSSVQLD